MSAAGSNRVNTAHRKADALPAIAALSVIWITGAVSNDDPNADNANVSAKLAAERDGETDHLGEPLPMQTSEDQQTVRDNLPVVEN